MAKALAFVVLLLISPSAYAAVHNVGGTGGWIATGAANYVTWAAGEDFVVGDTLVFNYGPQHGVYEVTEANFRSCGTTSPLYSNTTSPTTIPLNANGTRYFICPTPTHCSGGQKLNITILAAGSTPPPTSSTPSTPTGTPPTTPGTRSSPPPPSAATLAGGDSLMVGLMSLVLVAFLGLMS